MNKNTVIQVILRLRDEMGSVAKRALDALTQAARGTAQGAGASARALGEMNRAAGSLRSDRVRQAAQEAARLTRETREVRRELDSATRSGERLAGALSRVGGAGRAAMGVMRGMGQAGAGLAAGGMVAGRALAQPMDFDKRLALMTNTAFSDRDVAGRIAGKKELEGSINNAVRQGGGTRENAAEAWTPCWPRARSRPAKPKRSCGHPEVRHGLWNEIHRDCGDPHPGRPE